MAPAAKHRESLVASSMALLQRQGYAATGLAEILTESGAPRGSLYHYFPDGKEAIAEAAVRAAGAATEARIRDAAARVPHPPEFALLYGQTLARMMEASGYSRGCPIATVALETAPQSTRLTAAARDVLGSWCAAIADLLVAAGIAAPRAMELAELMLSAFQGALVLARVRQSSEPLAQTARQMARIMENELQATRTMS